MWKQTVCWSPQRSEHSEPIRTIQNHSEPLRTTQNHSEPFKTIQNYSELLRITLSPVTKAVRSNGVEVSRYIKWTYASKVT